MHWNSAFASSSASLSQCSSRLSAFWDILPAVTVEVLASCPGWASSCCFWWGPPLWVVPQFVARAATSHIAGVSLEWRNTQQAFGNNSYLSCPSCSNNLEWSALRVWWISFRWLSCSLALLAWCNQSPKLHLDSPGRILHSCSSQPFSHSSSCNNFSRSFHCSNLA